MTLVHMQRIEPEQNMARFYQVDVASTLFGEACVLRVWGRIGTSGRQVIETCQTPEEAEIRAAKAVTGKIRRGYRRA